MARVRWSLQTKIVLAVLAVMSVFGGLTLFHVWSRMSSALLAGKMESLKLASVEQTHEMSQLLSGAREAARSVVYVTGVREYLEEENRSVQDPVILRKIQEFGLGRPFLSIFLLDRNGLAYLSTDTSFLEKNFSFRGYFQKAIKGTDGFEVAIGSVTKELGIFFSSPIKNEREEVVGVAVVKMDPKSLFVTMDESYINSMGKYMLTDGDGVVIHTNKENALYRSLGQLSDDALLNIARQKRYLGRVISALDYEVAQEFVEKNEEKSFSYEFFDEEDNEEEIIEVDKVGDYPMYLVSELEKEEAVSAVWALVRIVMVLAGLMIGGGMVFVVLLLRGLLSPLGKLERYAREVASEKWLDAPVVKTGDELESLTDSIREMVARLKEFYGGLEGKVMEKTAMLEATLNDMAENNRNLEETKKAILNVMEDLSVEKERMANEKNRVETILASIGDGVFVTDASGRVSMVNGSAVEMAGFSSDEMIGKHYTEVLRFRKEADIEAEYPDFVGKVIETGQQKYLENHTVIIHKNGSMVSVLDSAAPVLDSSGAVIGCVVVFRNNSRERELERNKDDFLSVTSHQLRTPLGGMRWNLEMLIGGDAGELPKEAKSLAEEIYKSNLRMIELVNDMLNVNRIDQGRVLNEPSETVLGNVVEEAAVELKIEAERKKIKIKTNVDREIKLLIDQKRIREVVTNLLSNAVKYGREGGWVEVDLEKKEKEILLRVRDNGLGIPKSDQKRLFEKFFRAGNAVHSETEGTGLGLYVVQKFVEGWGGMITMKSVEGEGSTFEIRLPEKIVNSNKNE